MLRYSESAWKQKPENSKHENSKPKTVNPKTVNWNGNYRKEVMEYHTENIGY